MLHALCALHDFYQLRGENSSLKQQRRLDDRRVAMLIPTRKRGVRDKDAPGQIQICTWNREAVWTYLRRFLDLRKALTSLCAATCQYLATTLGLHTGAETDLASALDLRGLPCHFHIVYPSFAKN